MPVHTRQQLARVLRGGKITAANPSRKLQKTMSLNSRRVVVLIQRDLWTLRTLVVFRLMLLITEQKFTV